MQLILNLYIQGGHVHIHMYNNYTQNFTIMITNAYISHGFYPLSDVCVEVHLFTVCTMYVYIVVEVDQSCL